MVKHPLDFFSNRNTIAVQKKWSEYEQIFNYNHSGGASIKKGF
jgi:hypothetical protein